jgi:hypothetical protein
MARRFRLKRRYDHAASIAGAVEPFGCWKQPPVPVEALELGTKSPRWMERDGMQSGVGGFVVTLRERHRRLEPTIRCTMLHPHPLVDVAPDNRDVAHPR